MSTRPRGQDFYRRRARWQHSQRAAPDPLPDNTEATALLVALRERGVALRIDDGRLRWHAPSGMVGVADIMTMKAHETAIIAALGTFPYALPADLGLEAIEA